MDSTEQVTTPETGENDSLVKAEGAVAPEDEAEIISNDDAVFDGCKPEAVKEIIQEFTLTARSGPLPPVEDFAGYEKAVPGAGEIIMKMATDQIAHRIEMENKDQDHQISMQTKDKTFQIQSHWFGQVVMSICMFGLLGGGFYLLTIDKDAGGYIAMAIPIGSALKSVLYKPSVKVGDNSNSKKQKTNNNSKK